MKQEKPDKDFWENRYASHDIPWDIGYASTPLVEYFDSLTDRSLKILIPGAGNGYEAEYLFQKGFSNVYVLDISTGAINSFKSRVPEFPKHHIIEQDFFMHNDHYDLIVEQTFFCALHPDLRIQYVTKMHSLLKPEGKLVGLLFDAELNADKPPFGGSKKEYQSLFQDHFELLKFEPAKNSIKPREGKELFIELKKK